MCWFKCAVVGIHPRAILDIKALVETNRLEVGAEGIYIGSAVPSAVINENQQLQVALPDCSKQQT